MKKNKLILKKEKVATLGKQEMTAIQGGKSAKSTDANFTCCWCTDTDTDGGPGTITFNTTGETPGAIIK